VITHQRNPASPSLGLGLGFEIGFYGEIKGDVAIGREGSKY